MFETIRWSVLAFVLSRFAIGLQDRGFNGGFALLRNADRLSRAMLFGLMAGVLATGVVYGLSVVEHRLGYLTALPWPGVNDDPINVRLAFGGGLRNLAGEEVFARLGVQSIVLYLLRDVRGVSVLAVVLSSLSFELWHNGFGNLYFLNFAVSCICGWAYHKHGYESAAVAHCVTDWVTLGVLPPLLFG